MGSWQKGKRREAGGGLEVFNPGLWCFEMEEVGRGSCLIRLNESTTKQCNINRWQGIDRLAIRGRLTLVNLY